ncbi:hydroxypyruvate isomerase family protein [Tropicibacter oceani]|uniref:TIM barrel protein n=1 Tax=Tropicibacter oceani TaxID=3058420 RepID=A0ABY8QCW3_9RHOB|nr:TIM barrel protein [Tropicibacter oceani]WGW02465.1 TIM barrel protein [Tropicibacter oceani]
MTQFSANLGFLWQELSLPDAIRAAKAAGFDAVECHWPYDTPAEVTKAALAETGLRMLGINTVRGAAGENGLSALPGRAADARAAIDQALAYAAQIGAGAVHVMAGFSAGEEARKIFCENLAYAASAAAPLGITILIEPLNRHDAPGYFLQTTDQAAAIIAEVGAPNLKLMFDCYHIGRTEGDITTRFAALRGIVGHVQFAGVPTRGRPDQGELNYAMIFAQITGSGWSAPLGAEYKPDGPTGDSLGWMQALSQG